MLKKGFTLAEVLITLGIIGVVAAMTIPTLMNATQNAEFKTAYKKAFSTANQAWTMAIANDEVPDRVSGSDGAENVNFFNILKGEFNVVKDCNTDNNADCWTIDAKGRLPYSDARAFIDKSGMSWSMPCHPTSMDCGCDIIWVDVNGLKKPNQLGKDQFIFMLQNADGSGGPGFPTKLTPWDDETVVNANHCPSPPCYFTSWLINK